MFGTSGIRGVYGEEITESLSMKLGNAFADADIAIGRDIRKTGISLSLAAAAGVMAGGRGVYHLGIVPTPTVALATRKHSCNGIMVTASHNPDEYNGLKLLSGAKEIGKSMETEIVKRYKNDMRIVEWDKVGKSCEDSSIIQDHKSMILGLVDQGIISGKKPKIIVDCNGAGTVITPALLESLGCRVKAINTSLDSFTRPSEPNAQNLQGLASAVRSGNADFGIAHDGDADRVVIIDDLGEVLPLDVQLAIMIDHEMEGSSNKNIVSTIEASLAIRNVVERNKGSVTIMPVGSTYVADALEDRDALFGGEPCGEYVYSKGVHVPDGILAAAKFVEIFCTNGRFSEQRKKYPQNHMAREKFRMDKGKDKYDAVRKITSRIDIQGTRSEEDGVRIDEEDGWFLIRASGTEPLVRLTMEYKSKEKLDERKNLLLNIIREYI